MNREFTCYQLAEVIWCLCLDEANSFTEKLIIDFQGTPFAIEADKRTVVLLESVILHLWLVSKVLAPEKVLLDAVHECFLQRFKTPGATQMDSLRTKLLDRYTKYYGAWKGWDSNGLFSLADEILRCHLNNGKPDRRFLAEWPKIFPVVETFVLVVAKTRSQYNVARI
jgi:hypothetical protein